ncbi:hypothetical protein BDR06DRAFT_971615 [Suillus hirtellus]|nr:hypothetical protein BDR06DRAFT_971615 [Suillus hirtellus]
MHLLLILLDVCLRLALPSSLSTPHPSHLASDRYLVQVQSTSDRVLLEGICTGVIRITCTTALSPTITGFDVYPSLARNSAIVLLRNEGNIDKNSTRLCTFDVSKHIKVRLDIKSDLGLWIAVTHANPATTAAFGDRLVHHIRPWWRICLFHVFPARWYGAHVERGPVK